MNNLRKTHPMVLIAAVALTMFSLLGSAAITGLLPNVAEKEGMQAMEKADATDKNAFNAPAQNPDHNAVPKRDSQKNQIACLSCGTIVAILALEGQIANTSGNKELHMAPAYQIKLRMYNGTYQTITQQTRPLYLIGDVIRLQTRQATV